MNVDAKMIPVETIPGMEGWKKAVGEGWLKYDIFETL
jgi:hypothetical protein